MSTQEDRTLTLVMPGEDPTLGGTRALLELERSELEAVLDAPIELSERDPGSGPRWLLRLDGASDRPRLSFDPDGRLFVSRAADTDGLLESFSLLHTVLRRGGGEVEAADADTVDEAIDRISAEVADTYPAFELRSLDWAAISARHRRAVRGAADPIAACDRWLAQLQDAHTRVWPAAPQGHLPYALRVVGNAATFARVPAGTAARDAGVRPGWRLTALDGAAVEASAWLARTGASGHARPYIAGRRLLAAPAGAERELAAVSPEGHDASWQEPARPIPFDELVTRRRLPSGAGYVRIEAWAAGAGIEDALDEALSELRGADRLIVDLRGNPGGNLVLACATRQRFLRRETSLGSIRHSIGGGRLSQPYPLVAEPAAEGQRWRGRLIVLTDPLTYSSSEDFLLGLQGLDHVFVVGQPSGGGSGRPRSLRLLEGTTLTISTALTYDRLGRCIEGAGIPVDLQVPALPQVEPDPVLAAAESV